ncbi:MAG: indole-3-glycerol phosphate synthase TrpC [Salinivirgaceae bacterium]
MDSILEKIIAHKKNEVEQQKKLIPLNTLLLQTRKRPHYSLKERLSDPRSSGIIAEFKRRSPSKNWINQQASARETVKAYEDAGAAGLSILTDTRFFGGSMHDLIQTAPCVETPVLRKDFMIDEYQIVEAQKNGADVILLIAACLLPEEVLHLAKTAKELQLEVLLEIHHQQELKYITEEVDLVGINNRNLHTFATSLETSAELSPFIPDRCLKISESGISSALDINYLRHFGFKGFLMGEQFMKSAQPGLALKQFINEIS